MSNKLKLVGSKDLNRRNCFKELKSKGYLHQDNCPLCKKRIEASWAAILYIKGLISKTYPKSVDITNGDIRDVLLTALHNIDFNLMIFLSRIDE